ncbi:DegT/DnrJ/EryC1/StrS family aminotransferase [Thermodesulfobacteriota bacterium B35]
MNDTEFLPFALPLIGEDEINEVIDSLRSGWITTGPKVRRFERDFSAYLGGGFSIAVNSATSGLHLALECIGVGKGDRVITTPYTFTATAEVIRYLGADPIFVDIDPDTCNISPGSIARYLDELPDKELRRIKAILPVHFAGQACDMDPICEIARDYGLKVIEDAAHALPCTYKKRAIGTLGDITVFSFYVTKTLATGEGGMIVTNNEEWARHMKVMRLHGISRDVFARYRSNKPSWYYEVVAPGFKYNMPDIAAALGIHQLRKVDYFRQRRAEIARRYREGLGELPVRLPQVTRPDDIHAWHLYVIQLDPAECTIDRNRFIELMSEAGIGTSVHFIPLHIHPYWQKKYGLAADDYPVAYSVYSRSVSLPIYPAMSDRDVERVVHTVRTVVQKYGRD